MTVEIIYVSAEDTHLDGCEAITEIGWVTQRYHDNPDGYRVGFSDPEQMYEFVDKTDQRVYFRSNDNTATLEAVDGQNKKHVATPFGTYDDDLLNLGQSRMREVLPSVPPEVLGYRILGRGVQRAK